ncbi:MAG: hypothetical protein LBS99_06240 [Clostridiales bacterium]|jgi:hypothetical protein|nr:hypothetical protein [Clostridiales bacterium]
MKLLKAVANIFGFLLFRLYLIIPALYALLLAIGGLFFGYKISDFSILYVIGIAICVALSGVLVLKKHVFREKRPERVTDRRSAKEQYTAPSAFSERERSVSGRPPREKSADAPEPRKANPYDYRKPAIRTEEAEDAFGQGTGYEYEPETEFDPKSKYPGSYKQDREYEPTPAPPRKTDFPNPRRPEAYSEPDFGHEESPRLYRTRQDPDLFVAEYSDRIDVYRRGADGQMYFERSSPKG